MSVARFALAARSGRLPLSPIPIEQRAPPQPLVTGVRGFRAPRPRPPALSARRGIAARETSALPWEPIDRGRRGPGAREDRTRFGARRAGGSTRLAFGSMTEKTDKKRDAPISYPPAGRPGGTSSAAASKRPVFPSMPISPARSSTLAIPRGTRHPARRKTDARAIARPLRRDPGRSG